MSDLRCIIFDVDGTLVDSQADIVASMTAAFEVIGRPLPARETLLSVVGLSLEQGMARLCPDADAGELVAMLEGYRGDFQRRRLAAGTGHAKFYPGMRELLDLLAGTPGNLLCIATGKSRRGLDGLLASCGLTGFFMSEQVADDHPSKPSPSMVLAALAATGVEPSRAVMIGDTSFDIEMGRNAGINAIGVGWGYHPAGALAEAGALEIVTEAAALPAAILRATGG